MKTPRDWRAEPSLRARNENLLQLAAWYSRHSPIGFGKAPLERWVLRRISPVVLEVELPEGFQFELRFPEDTGWESIFFRRTFETGTTELLKRIVRPDDVVLDIGANLGWYTLLLSQLARRGQCHAFEPVPAIFARLQRNCELNRLSGIVAINQLALGERKGVVEIHTFAGLPPGHSSLSTLGRDDFQKISVPMTTLDSYLAERALQRIDLVKIDVEGAELSVLQGAESLLHSAAPPMWLIEMNIETSRSFGYAPEDLLEFLQNRSEYRFYRVDEGWGRVSAMRSISAYAHGDNVLALPAHAFNRFASGEEGRVV